MLIDTKKVWKEVKIACTTMFHSLGILTFIYGLAYLIF